MAVIFHVKGTSLDATVSQAGKTPTKVGAVSVLAGSGTGIISDSVIDCDQGVGVANMNMLIYNGHENTSGNKEMSVLYRVAYSDVSGQLRLWHLGNAFRSNQSYGSADFANQGSCSVAWAASLFYNLVSHENGVTDYPINLVAAGSFTPTVNQYHDYCVTFSGDNTANAFKMYIDGVLEYQITPTTGSFWADSKDQSLVSKVMLNSRDGTAVVSAAKINEFVIWDGIIDPTSSGLDLKGEDRTSFVTSTDFDGLNSVSAGASNIATGVTEVINGSTITGTLDAITNTVSNQSAIGANRDGTATAS